MLGMTVASGGCLFCVSTCTWEVTPQGLLAQGPDTHTHGACHFSLMKRVQQCHGCTSADPATTAGEGACPTPDLNKAHTQPSGFTDPCLTSCSNAAQHTD